MTAATWTLSPAEVEARLTDRTRAIIAVDVLGHPADYDALGGFDVPVISDAAEALGSAYKGRATGSLGDVAVFSFHAITTDEGGAVCTDDPKLAERMRQIVGRLKKRDLGLGMRTWSDDPAPWQARQTAVAPVSALTRRPDIIGPGLPDARGEFLPSRSGRSQKR